MDSLVSSWDQVKSDIYMSSILCISMASALEGLRVLILTGKVEEVAEEGDDDELADQGQRIVFERPSLLLTTMQDKIPKILE